MRVERRDTQFRVIAQAFSPVWLEDPPSHRKALVVLLRSLQDESGTGLFPYEQLAVLVGSSNRQAAHEHVQGVEESGGGSEGFFGVEAEGFAVEAQPNGGWGSGGGGGSGVGSGFVGRDGGISSAGKC